MSLTMGQASSTIEEKENGLRSPATQKGFSSPTPGRSPFDTIGGKGTNADSSDLSGQQTVACQVGSSTVTSTPSTPGQMSVPVVNAGEGSSIADEDGVEKLDTVGTGARLSLSPLPETEPLVDPIGLGTLSLPALAAVQPIDWDAPSPHPERMASPPEWGCSRSRSTSTSSENRIDIRRESLPISESEIGSSTGGSPKKPSPDTDAPAGRRRARTDSSVREGGGSRQRVGHLSSSSPKNVNDGDFFDCSMEVSECVQGRGRVGYWYLGTDVG
ncbi:unnamed protein product [Choristocarpus tenellus]